MLARGYGGKQGVNETLVEVPTTTASLSAGVPTDYQEAETPIYPPNKENKR